MLTRRVPLLALALVAALAVVACGSSDTAQSVLSQTFATNRDAKVQSGRVTLRLDSTVQGVQGLAGADSIGLSGPFQSAGDGQPPKFDFTLSRSNGGQSVTAGIVSTGTQGFLRFAGQAYSMSPALYARLRQVAGGRKGGSLTPSLSSLGVNPERWLLQPRIVGHADVGGADTIHVQAGVDVPRFLEDASRLLARASSVTQGQASTPLQLTPQQRQAIEKSVKDATVNVYTGADDKLLRKLDLRVVVGPSGNARGGTLHFLLELDDLNADQTITAPAHSQPLQVLLAQLQRQAGGAAGQTGGHQQQPAQQQPAQPQPSQPQAPANGAGGAGQSAYLRCIQQAGNDLAKQQACSKYL